MSLMPPQDWSETQSRMPTSWWPTFSRGASSSPANFLHLPRTNIEKILDLSKCCGEPLNPQQCRSLSFKLEKAIQSIEYLVACSAQFSLVRGSAALQNFYRVSEKAKQLVEKCCSVNWCREAAFQMQNEEAFKEILLEASLCYNTIYALVEDLNQNRDIVCCTVDLRKTITFEPPTTGDVLKDRIALCERLNYLVINSSVDSQSQHLAKYLLARLWFVLQQSIDEDFDVRSYSLWSDGKGPDGEWSKELEHLGGDVYTTTWLDVPCAKKLFKDEMQEDEWLAEAKILASLNHPNIVKFLCCNKYETKHSWGHFIAMEQMETSLGSFIKRLVKEGAKLPLVSALDIILQIAYGMCYLHENGVAHRGLKPSNVVVCSIGALHLQHYLHVKVVDFGLSKVKLKASKSNTISRPKIGTTLYMPPEAFTSGRANWFKADVYSFSVMCAVILSGKEPFEGIKRSDIYAAICRGERPKLPADIPQELALLIAEGWATNRDLRPDFVYICTRLEKLRHWFLRQQTPGSTLQQENSYSNFYIEETLERRSEVREHQRSHVSPQIPVGFSDDDECLDCDEKCKAEADPDHDDKTTLTEWIVSEADPQKAYDSDDTDDLADSDVHFQPLVSAGPALAVIYASDDYVVDGINWNGAISKELSCIIPGKLTLEIRPPRFKEKLWFGTWLPEEIDRARDAINFYTRSNEPFILPDSPLIFAEHPLGIEYQDLLLSCEEYIRVGQKQVRASEYFSSRVRQVIKAVSRGKKVSFAGGASSEANSELTRVHPSFLPPSQLLPFEGEIPIESDLFSLCNWSGEMFFIEEITFPSCPSVAASGEVQGECGMVEDNDFTALNLWLCQS